MTALLVAVVAVLVAAAALVVAAVAIGQVRVLRERTDKLSERADVYEAVFEAIGQRRAERDQSPKRHLTVVS